MVLFIKKNYQKEKQTKTTEPPFSKIRNTKRYFHHDKNISMGVNYRLLFSLIRLRTWSNFTLPALSEYHNVQKNELSQIWENMFYYIR